MTRKFDPKAKRKTIPELLYQSDSKGKVINPIPYIETDKTDPMPVMLFVEEVYNTGEVEVGDDGNPSPIYEFEMHQFLNMRVLKDVLNSKQYDKVRVALGMETMQKAKEKGEKIINAVESAIAKKEGGVN
ncbi:MAG TPA: hypothetical protein PLP33_10360 [Leptospiraceae bacterium]|nr:hypothetical protein [Leptospiraceae bacterium]